MFYEDSRRDTVVALEKRHPTFRGGLASGGEKHIEHGPPFLLGQFIQGNSLDHSGFAQLFPKRNAGGVDEMVVAGRRGPQEPGERGHISRVRMGSKRFGGIAADKRVRVRRRVAYRIGEGRLPIGEFAGDLNRVGSHDRIGVLQGRKEHV